MDAKVKSIIIDLSIAVLTAVIEIVKAYKG